jgi:hypothetical protein
MPTRDQMQDPMQLSDILHKMIVQNLIRGRQLDKGRINELEDTIAEQKGKIVELESMNKLQNEVIPGFLKETLTLGIQKSFENSGIMKKLDVSDNELASKL